MKYGETAFDIFYLAYAIFAGIRILQNRRDEIGKLMGSAVLILGCGDAFHLIPRILNYFISRDWTAWLGFGKLVTSITMTVFYLILYRLWLSVFGEKEKPKLSLSVYVLSILRIILCLLPQNRWLQNDSPMVWAIIRNIPFVVLGGIDVYLFYRKRNAYSCFRSVWLLITLSFLFYIPVAVASSLLPMLGMLMLPKTVCYMFLILVFLRCSYQKKDGSFSET